MWFYFPMCSFVDYLGLVLLIAILYDDCVIVNLFVENKLLRLHIIGPDGRQQTTGLSNLEIVCDNVGLSEIV